MSKYGALYEYLRAADKQRLRLRFADIERVLGDTLPGSARRHQAWWANDATTGRHASAWLSAGWRTADLDLAGEMVSFERADAYEPRGARSRQQGDMDALEDALNGRVQAAIDMRWKQLGAVTLDDSGGLCFPAVPAEPGLYRLRLQAPGGHRHYVGESVNLRRRFGNYRNPGPTQATSIRINAVLHEHLAAGERIAIDVIFSEITLQIGGAGVAANLADKQMRRLLEQAALIVDGAADIESLNR